VDDTGHYGKAYITYEAGLKHDSKNDELKDGMSVARDGIQKDPMAVMAALGDEAKQFVEGGVGDPELGAILRDPVVIQVRGLHSFTFQLEVSAFYGIGGASKGCLGGIKENQGVLGGVLGVLSCQTRLKLS
jgi:hypothetical protein